MAAQEFYDAARKIAQRGFDKTGKQPPSFILFRNTGGKLGFAIVQSPDRSAFQQAVKMIDPAEMVVARSAYIQDHNDREAEAIILSYETNHEATLAYCVVTNGQLGEVRGVRPTMQSDIEEDDPDKSILNLLPKHTRQ